MGLGRNEAGNMCIGKKLGGTENPGWDPEGAESGLTTAETSDSPEL